MDPLVMQDRYLIGTNSSSLNSSADSNATLPTLEALSDPYQSILTVVYIITAVLAFLMNVIALIMLLGRQSNKPQQLKMYLSNLAIADLLVALFSIPFTYVDLMFGQWIFPLFLCPIVHFIQTISAIVSIYTLIAIGIGRYFAIVTVLEHLRVRRSHTMSIVSSIWFFSVLIASPLLFQARASPFKYGSETLYDCREVWEGELSAKIYSGFVFALTFFLPFAALSFLYGSIGITIARHRTPGDECTENQIQNHKKFKVVKMLLILVTAFAICWTPLQLLNLLLWFCDSLREVDGQFQYYLYFGIYFSCHWISCLSSIINPIIYCFLSENFKMKDLIAIITCTQRSHQQKERYRRSFGQLNTVPTIRRKHVTTTSKQDIVFEDQHSI